MLFFKRFAMLILLLSVGLLLVIPWGESQANAQAATPEATPDTSQVPFYSLDALNARDLSIDMGEGWTSKAEFTWPKQGQGPFPAVILFQGGCGCGDMDESNQEYNGVTSRNFRLLAAELGKQGIAVLRFNRRGTIAAGNVDSAQEGRNFSEHLRAAADGEAALATLEQQPEVDKSRLFLYGWSEGAVEALNLAPYHGDLKGLILQGSPVSENDPVESNYRNLQYVIPYLARVADKNQDGKLSGQELYDADPKIGPVDWIMYSIFSSDSSPQKPVFAEGLDKDGDDLLDITTELTPSITASGETYAQGVSDRYSTAQVDAIARIQMPVLILDGKLDGLIPPASPVALAKAAGDRATLKLYEGLGHALSKVSEPALDVFGPMEQQPIDDIAAWILAQK